MAVPYFVSPSPAKCFAVASTRSLSFSWPGPPWKPSIAVSMRSTSAGSSPKPSYVRPQRSSWAEQMHGANVHCGPLARVSSAVTCSTARTSPGSRLAPSPMLCGKTVAPYMLPSPWTESMPYSSGMCSGVASAAAWKRSIMSAQAAGVLSVGVEPPPDRMAPRR